PPGRPGRHADARAGERLVLLLGRRSGARAQRSLRLRPRPGGAGPAHRAGGPSDRLGPGGLRLVLRVSRAALGRHGRRCPRGSRRTGRRRWNRGRTMSARAEEILVGLAVVRARNQITIPPEIADVLDVQVGDTLRFAACADGAVKRVVTWVARDGSGYESEWVRL